MNSCCENKAGELAQLRAKQGRVLYIVLAINAVMFLFEFISGWLARSTALLGDSLDMFGDASVYALTIYALQRSARTRAAAALFKGAFMLLFGLVVIGDALRKSVLGVVPEAEWMGVVGLIALAANTVCFMLLYRHRSDDLNMRSTWLCSRNDLIANTSVIAAAVLVGLTGTLWPDVLVGLAIAALFLHSAWQVLREAWQEWRAHSPQTVETVSTVEPSGACCGTDIVARADSCCGTDAAAQADSCCGASAVDAKTKSEREQCTTH
ncbi:cation transporter [Alkalilimnicola sp. S0819]|uniref:cation transporter n=1 Tax=Alkalilimnicola sp. S0819 TaxID=2613922 RepID=UPI0012622A48|nr:cation diffusion facilitator family transporter [Alkalilimnicola sp. S0819]KAB7623398.1 cation transporter [Alkalilimnicola sp. S0819]MPQ16944.1 cation transporter [Alkalilimnicola sp. S0819]